MNGMIFKFIWIAAGIIMLVFYARRKHTVKSVFYGMLSGAAALIILHYFGESIGFIPKFNLFNTSVALVLGAPGIIMMLAVNKIL